MTLFDNNPAAIQRYRGCLLGLAIGDAVGTTLEFQTPGSFTPIDDMIGGGPFHLEAGQWTDDTSMALCLAESLLQQRGFDPKDQITRYLKWYHHGHLSSTGRCFDIGNTTLAALMEFERTGNPYSGLTNPRAAGNGSIMRLAPVPLAYAFDPDKSVYFSAQSSRTTHGTKAAVDACRYLGGLITGAVLGISKEDLLSEEYHAMNGPPLTDQIQEIASGSFRHCQPPQIKGSSYVVRSLEAALWVFYHSESFREGCLLAVNLGDDADTTGAVYGQLAGAYYGEEAIPISWREKLSHRSLIETFAEQLLALREELCSRQEQSNQDIDK